MHYYDPVWVDDSLRFPRPGATHHLRDKDHQIGYIRYYVNTGQIGLFFIQKEYQNRGLGKQILCKVIQELQENNCDEIWAVTSKDHAFWSNVYHQSFSYRDPAHPSVGGDGYFMDLRVHEGLTSILGKLIL